VLDFDCENLPNVRIFESSDACPEPVLEIAAVAQVLVEASDCVAHPTTPEHRRLRHNVVCVGTRTKLRIELKSQPATDSFLLGENEDVSKDEIRPTRH
jgi:hypothetical protein